MLTKIVAVSLRSVAIAVISPSWRTFQISNRGSCGIGLTRYIRKFVFNCEHFFAYFWKARGSGGDAAVVNRGGQAKGATWKSPSQSRVDYTREVHEGETPSVRAGLALARETRVLPGRRTEDEREQERNVEHRTSNVEHRTETKKGKRFTRGRRRGRREAEE
jgi:hypothetical protein